MKGGGVNRGETMDRKTRIVCALSGAALALTVTTAPAFACVCVAPTLREAFDRADLVIRGHVEQVHVNLFTMQQSATIRVVERWKGPDRNKVRIRLGIGIPFMITSCDGSLLNDAEYLIFANQGAMGFGTHDCNGNTQLPKSPFDPERFVTRLSAGDRAVLGAPMPSRKIPLLWFDSLPSLSAIVTYMVMVWVASRFVRRHRPQQAKAGARYGRWYGWVAGALAGVIVGAVWLAFDFGPLMSIRPNRWQADLAELGSFLATAVRLGAGWGGMLGAVAGHFGGTYAATVSANHVSRVGVAAGVAAAVIGVWMIQETLAVGEYLIAAVLIAAVAGLLGGRRFQQRFVQVTRSSELEPVAGE